MGGADNDLCCNEEQQQAEQQQAECSTMVCPSETHVADDSAGSLLCIGETCDDLTGDLETCCNARAACSTLVCHQIPMSLTT